MTPYHVLPRITRRMAVQHDDRSSSFMLSTTAINYQYSSSTETAKEEVKDILRKMTYMEGHYKIVDYLCASVAQEEQQCTDDKEDEEDKRNDIARSVAQNDKDAITDDDDDENDEHQCCSNRRLMGEWCYTLVDHFDLPRDLVAYTMNFVDRFFSVQYREICQSSDCLLCSNSERNMHRHDILQLVTTASLFLSIKMHHPGGYQHHGNHSDDYCTNDTMSRNRQNSISKQQQLINLLPHYTRGQCSLQTITKFEPILLSTLGFYLSPPLPERYIQEYRFLLSLQPELLKTQVSSSLEQRKINIHPNIRSCVVDSTDTTSDTTEDSRTVDQIIESLERWAVHLIDLAVLEYSLSTIRPSLLALASLINSIALYGLCNSTDDDDTDQAQDIMANDKRSDDIVDQVASEDKEKKSGANEVTPSEETKCQKKTSLWCVDLSSFLLQQLNGVVFHMSAFDEQELNYASETIWNLLLNNVEDFDISSLKESLSSQNKEYATRILLLAYDRFYHQEQRLSCSGKDECNKECKGAPDQSSSRDVTAMFGQTSPASVITNEFKSHTQKS